MNSLASRALRVAVIVGLLFAIALAWLYGTLFSTIKAEVSLAVSVLFGIDADLAQSLGLLVALVAAPVCVTLGLRLLVGGLPWGALVGLLVAGTLLAAAVGWLRADWMFSPDGQHARFLCPPVVADAMPRVQNESHDRVTGLACTALSPRTAPVVVALRKGVLPQRLKVETIEQLDALQLFDRRNGMPLVYAGVPDNASGLPALYLGAGFDPHAPRLLEPFGVGDRTRIRNALLERERRARAESVAAEQHALAVRRKEQAEVLRRVAAAEARALATLRAGPDAIPSLAYVQAPLFPRELPLEGPRRSEGVVALPPSDQPWTRFFTHDPEAGDGGLRTAYLVVRRGGNTFPATWLPDLTLDDASLPLASLARPELYASVDFVALLREGRPETLASLNLPPRLGALVIVDVIEVCDHCARPTVMLRWLRLEAATRRVSVQVERKQL